MLLAPQVSLQNRVPLYQKRMVPRQSSRTQWDRLPPVKRDGGRLLSSAPPLPLADASPLRSGTGPLFVAAARDGADPDGAGGVKLATHGHDCAVADVQAFVPLLLWEIWGRPGPRWVRAWLRSRACRGLLDACLAGSGVRCGLDLGECKPPTVAAEGRLVPKFEWMKDLLCLSVC